MEPDWNVTVERDLHSEKHFSPNFVTDEGMQMDESDQQGEIQTARWTKVSNRIRM
jgi:hypothetical protein